MTRAEMILALLRLAWGRKTEGPNAELIKRHGVLMIGYSQLDENATEERILKLASGAATLRQVDDGPITYHDVHCTVCTGKGGDCATCGGDGFSPPR